ncbi:P27 family phage terminase small subunit [Burkholderia multivorans]|nr:P27 family phage terminase small subunit [Burkholderia multivorans]
MHLNREARKEWKRITVELEKLGLISRLDRAALTLCCQAWGRLVESPLIPFIQLRAIDAVSAAQLAMQVTGCARVTDVHRVQD